jgi:hypothetical protein
VSDDQAEGRGFTVTDRRRFSPETGEVRGDVAGQGEPGPSRADAAAPAEPRAPQAPHAAAAGEITLSTFVISLSTQALMDLGEIPNPVSQRVERDLEAARQMIDILGMLKAKMKGNLEPGEDALFDSVLYDLRMKFVELSKQP